MKGADWERQCPISTEKLHVPHLHVTHPSKDSPLSYFFCPHLHVHAWCRRLFWVNWWELRSPNAKCMQVVLPTACCRCFFREDRWRCSKKEEGYNTSNSIIVFDQPLPSYVVIQRTVLGLQFSSLLACMTCVYFHLKFIFCFVGTKKFPLLLH
jgi:hypothetical protein